MNTDVYPSISDYAYIADCHSSALISRWGSIDWCCMPRIDSKSCFGRLLGWKRGGYCQVAPAKPYKTSRRYLENTLVLETTFQNDQGEARLLDCFTMRKGGKLNPHKQILRIVEGVRGRLDLIAHIAPCFDYGAIKPWIRKYKGDHHIAIGGSDGLLICGDIHLEIEHRHFLTGLFSVEKGQRLHLSIVHRWPEELDENIVEVPGTQELERHFQETVDWWRFWTSKGKVQGPYAPFIRRSSIVLKGLTNAPTGAIAAAPTTSLPESFGGTRNWDYRYAWIRDSSLTVRSLAEIGHVGEADGFRRFLERSAAGSADEVQILFGVGGERRLHEYEIKELEGYRKAKPVRVGNAAAKQTQLDMYGELLDLAWRWHIRGYSPDDDYWEFLTELVNAAAKKWSHPDRGIWEMRGEPRHFVFSKAMCWAALDRGVKLAEDLGRKAPLSLWKKTRNEVCRAIEKRGYDAERGVFIQAFDKPEMDASLLLLPTVGFVAYEEERMIRTTDAIRKDLQEDGLLRRYPAGNDAMEGKEGVFLACSFWLVECLARQGRVDEAHEVFKHALSTANDVGLFSEEYDSAAREMLGNFPQGLSHLSLIVAAVALSDMERKAGPKRE
jgi:GH15 family glucan-1,4-alpha-glucosidase